MTRTRAYTVTASGRIDTAPRRVDDIIANAEALALLSARARDGRA